MTTTAEVKFRSSCDLCLVTKVKCSQTKPSCEKCTRQGLTCVYSQYRRVGRPSSFHRKRAAVAEAETRHRYRHDPGPSSILASDTAQSPLPRLTNLVRTIQQSTEDRQTSFQDDGGKAPGCDVGVVPAPEYVAAFNTGNDQAGDELDWLEFSLGDMIDSSTHAPGDPNACHQIQSRQSPASATSLRSSSHSLSRDLDWVSSSHIHQSPRYFPALEKQDLSHSSTDRFSVGSGDRLPPSATEPSTLSSASTNVPLLFGPSSAPSPSFSDGSNLFRVQNSRCILRCQADSARQLGEFSEYQDSDSGLALDLLLAVEARVRELLHKVLRCGFCMARSRCAQTLIIVVMVMTNLHGLFERSCGAAGGAIGTHLTHDAPSVASYADNNLRVPSGTLAGWQGSVWSSDTGHGHLMVGKTRLDESVKGAFSRILLHVYLNRQNFHVQQLERSLKGVDRVDVNCKVANDLLEDVAERLDTFKGFLSLMDTSETLSVHKVLS